MTIFGYTNLKDNEPCHKTLERQYNNRMRLEDLCDKVTKAGIASEDSGELELFTFEGSELIIIAEPYQWLISLNGSQYKLPDYHYEGHIGGLLKWIEKTK